MMGKVVVHDSDRDTTGFPLLVDGGGNMANVGDRERENPHHYSTQYLFNRIHSTKIVCYVGFAFSRCRKQSKPAEIYIITKS